MNINHILETASFNTLEARLECERRIVKAVADEIEKCITIAENTCVSSDDRYAASELIVERIKAFKSIEVWGSYYGVASISKNDAIRLVSEAFAKST